MRDEFAFLTQSVIENITVFTQSTLPDIYYHSTANKFDEFCLTMKGQNTGYKNTVHGFCFTTKAGMEVLKKAHPKTFGDIVLPVRLDIRKPIYLVQEKIFTEASQASAIWELLMGEKVDNAKALALLQDEIGLGEIADVWDQIFSEHGHETIRANGYDGIISKIGNEHPEFIAFDPDQIQILTKEAIIESYKKGFNKELMKSVSNLQSKQKIKFKL